MSVIVASYSETNRDDVEKIEALTPSAGAGRSEVGQSFTTPNAGVAYQLKRATFFLMKSGLPTGNAVAKLMTVPPAPAVIATSDAFDISTLGGAYALKNFDFSGVNQVLMNINTQYMMAIGFVAAGLLNGANFVRVGNDTSAPAYAGGNEFYFNNGGWSSYAGGDCCFYIYGDPVGGSKRLLVNVGL